MGGTAVIPRFWRPKWPTCSDPATCWCGSTPRPAGAKMAMTAHGDVAGSISGGCVDTDVIEHAMEVLRSGRPQIVEYGYSPDMTWEVGLMCGGSVQVFIEPLEGGAAGPVDDAWVTDLAQQAGEPSCSV